jgi:hypothetical protein
MSISIIATAALLFSFLVLPITAQAQSQNPMLSMFCAAQRMGLATSNQVNMCPVPGLLQSQQQQSSSANTAGTCPSEYYLSLNQCLPLNGAATSAAANSALQPVTCSVANGTPVTPLTVIVSTPSQIVSHGSPVTLTAVATPGTYSSGQGISSTCSTTTGVIPPGGYSWVQTAGSKINATTTNTATLVFTAPTVSTTLAFTTTVNDGVQTVTSAPTFIAVR